METPAKILSLPVLPDSTCIISLTFCPVQTALYACIGLPKSKVSGGASSADTLLPGLWQVDKLYLTDDVRKQYQQLIEQHTEWCENTSKFVCTYVDVLTKDIDTYSNTFSPKANGTELGQQHQHSEVYRTMKKAEHALEEQFRDFISNFDQFLSPLFGAGTVLDTFITSNILNSNNANNNHNLVLLLGDETLHTLPWEATTISKRFNGRVSRDYSIHVLGARSAPMTTSANATAVPANTPSAPASASDKVIVLSANLQLIVDPNGDDDSNAKTSESSNEVSGNNEEKKSDGKVLDGGDKDRGLENRKSIKEIVSSLRAKIKGGQNWSQVISLTRENEGIPLYSWILQSYTNSLASAPTIDKSLFVYVPGKMIGNILSGIELSSLNFQNVSFAYISNLSPTYNSYRKQLSVDSRKDKEELYRENVVNTHALMTLSGIGNIVSYQWTTTATSQERNMYTFWSTISNGALGSNIYSALGMCRGNRIDNTAMTASSTSTSGSGGVIDAETSPGSLKRWLKYAVVYYGCANVVYVEGSIPSEAPSGKGKK